MIHVKLLQYPPGAHEHTVTTPFVIPKICIFQLFDIENNHFNEINKFNSMMKLLTSLIKVKKSLLGHKPSETII